MFLGIPAETWAIYGSIAGIVGVVVVIIGLLYRFTRWSLPRLRRKPQEPPQGAEPTAPKPIPLSRYFAPQRYHENPLNVVLEAYLALESWYDRTLTSHGIDNHDGTRKLEVDEMADLAVYHGLTEPRAAETVRGIGILREIYMGKVDPVQARSYVTQIDGQMFAMDGQLRDHDAGG
jgi:hypothetical protein